MDWIAFIGGFFSAAIVPGMNMMMALTVSLSVGYKKAFIFIITSSVCLGLIVLLSGLGIGVLIKNFPSVFKLLHIFGGLFLIFIGYGIWRRTKIGQIHIDKENLSTSSIIFQGFVSTFGDPIIWGAMISLLPKFMNANDPYNSTFFAFIFVVAAIEFVATNIYAIGGYGVSKFFSARVGLINKISGAMFILLGLLMLLDVVKS